MRTMMVLLVAVGSGACVEAPRDFREEVLEPAEVPFSSAEVQGIGREFVGNLSWLGGGDGAERFFTLSPSAGEASLLLTATRLPGDAAALKRPCTPPTIGNHVPDCRAFLRFAVRVVADSSDGAIAEVADGEIRAFSQSDWSLSLVLPALSRKGTFLVVDRTGGELSLTFVAAFAQGRLEGRFGGVSRVREESGGTATGFTAAAYSLELR
jgi:hypothetical protein